MVYQLTVVNGLDEGTRFRVEGDPVIVGRSPSAGVVLREETVGWEHITLRVEGDRLYVQNLSARGTKLKGRRIGDETRLSIQDEIELSETCRIRVDSQRGSSGGSKIAALALIVVLVLALGGITMVLLSGEDEAQHPPLTSIHWHTAYVRLDERIDTWVKKGKFPPEAQTYFHDGWRLEAAGNKAAAHSRWKLLLSMMLTLRSPAEEDGNRSIMEQAGTTRRALEVVMGYDTKSALDFAWQSDASHADALVWFVRYRQQMTAAPK